MFEKNLTKTYIADKGWRSMIQGQIAKWWWSRNKGDQTVVSSKEETSFDGLVCFLATRLDWEIFFLFQLLMTRK